MRTRWNNWSFGIHFLCRVSAHRCETFFEPQALALHLPISFCKSYNESRGKRRKSLVVTIGTAIVVNHGMWRDRGHYRASKMLAIE